MKTKKRFPRQKIKFIKRPRCELFYNDKIDICIGTNAINLNVYIQLCCTSNAADEVPLE